MTRYGSILSFQSTHPCGVRRVKVAKSANLSVISIHAPTWGATLGGRWSRDCGLYFNPRTHVGCDRIQGNALLRWKNFNPRTHVGCDLDSKIIVGNARNFNPRTHVGCDDITRSTAAIILRFQSTHPRGVRHSESDKLRDSALISIHAPTWGATRGTQLLL